MWTLKENNSNCSSGNNKSTFIDLNAKIYRNPNAALEILPAREQQKNTAVSETRRKKQKKNNNDGKLVLGYI